MILCVYLMQWSNSKNMKISLFPFASWSLFILLVIIKVSEDGLFWVPLQNLLSIPTFYAVSMAARSHIVKINARFLHCNFDFFPLVAGGFNLRLFTADCQILGFAGEGQFPYRTISMRIRSFAKHVRKTTYAC